MAATQRALKCDSPRAPASPSAWPVCAPRWRWCRLRRESCRKKQQRVRKCRAAGRMDGWCELPKRAAASAACWTAGAPKQQSHEGLCSGSYANGVITENWLLRAASLMFPQLRAPRCGEQDVCWQHPARPQRRSSGSCSLHSGGGSGPRRGARRGRAGRLARARRSAGI
jgi:hypothetical protein